MIRIGLHLDYISDQGLGRAIDPNPASQNPVFFRLCFQNRNLSQATIPITNDQLA